MSLLSRVVLLPYRVLLRYRVLLLYRAGLPYSAGLRYRARLHYRAERHFRRESTAVVMNTYPRDPCHLSLDSAAMSPHSLDSAEVPLGRCVLGLSSARSLPLPPNLNSPVNSPVNSRVSLVN